MYKKGKKGNHTFAIKCNDCGYEGTTDTIAVFHSVVKYVCPKCESKNIKYKPRKGMEWMAGMVRKWEKDGCRDGFEKVMKK